MEAELNDLDLSDTEIEEFFRENDTLWEEESKQPGEEVNQCYCGVPSTSEQVIRCDNAKCTKQWFHLGCVGLKEKLEGEWFCCPNCLEESVTTHPGIDVAVPGTSTSSDGVTNQSSSLKRTVSSPPTGKMKYPKKKKLEKTQAVSRAVELLDTALENLSKSYVFKMNTPMAISVRDLCKQFKGLIHTNDVKSFTDNLVGLLWDIACSVRGKRWTEEVKSNMWHEMHVMRISSTLRKEWCDLLTVLSIKREKDEELFLFQHVLEDIFKSLLTFIMESDLPPKPVNINIEGLDSNEEQALRYASGYIPYKLKRRFKNMKKSQVTSKFLEVLDSWTDADSETESFLDYTKEWITLQNRGGLFKVSDGAYQFFRAIELIVRSVLHTKNIFHLQSVDIQQALFCQMQQEKTVTTMWKKIVVPLPPTLSQKLFEEVLKAFLKMRCEAFVKVYLMIRKDKELNVSRKAEKSLRKELNK